jgi:hypothetical protein
VPLHPGSSDWAENPLLRRKFPFLATHARLFTGHCLAQPNYDPRFSDLILEAANRPFNLFCFRNLRHYHLLFGFLIAAVLVQLTGSFHT